MQQLLQTPNNSEPAWYIHCKLPEHLQVTPEIFERLWNLHPDELGKVKLFGKIIDTPRYQKNFGESYYYTGLVHPANPITDTYLQELLNWVRTHSGKDYRQMIINWYRDGNDYIGPHSDSLNGLVQNSAIYSISFGATRDFIITSKEGDARICLPLEDNDLLIMGGTMQIYYKHEVPKAKDKGKRINITFRLLKH